MIKKTILEIIKKRLKPIDETNQFGLQYIEGYCDQVWQEFVINMERSSDYDPNFYNKEYTVNGMSGSGVSGYYIDLPEEIINIPKIGSGVVSIKIKDTFNYFEPVSEDDFKHIRTQGVFRQADDVYFYVSYAKIFFGGGGITGTVPTDSMVLTLNIPFSKYLLTEVLPLPSIRESLFIDTVVERLMGTPPPDLINNNSDQ